MQVDFSVPKVMPLIRAAGETFCGHSGVLCTCRGLKDVKKVEPNRLLDLERRAMRTIFPNVLYADVAPAPEIMHVLLLRAEQVLEPVGHNAIQCPLGTTAEFFGRGRRRRMVDHVFGELDWTIGPRLNREGDLAEILGVDCLVGRSRTRFPTRRQSHMSR